MIVEYIIHSDIPNYTKLAFNSWKIIQNDSLSANQTPFENVLLVTYCDAIVILTIFASWLDLYLS